MFLVAPPCSVQSMSGFGVRVVLIARRRVRLRANTGGHLIFLINDFNKVLGAVCAEWCGVAVLLLLLLLLMTMMMAMLKRVMLTAVDRSRGLQAQGHGQTCVRVPKEASGGGGRRWHADANANATANANAMGDEVSCCRVRTTC